MEEEWSLIPESILKSLVFVHNQLFGSRDLVEHVSFLFGFFPLQFMFVRLCRTWETLAYFSFLFIPLMNNLCAVLVGQYLYLSLWLGSFLHYLGHILIFYS